MIDLDVCYEKGKPTSHYKDFLTLPSGWTARIPDCSVLRPFCCWLSAHPRC